MSQVTFFSTGDLRDFLNRRKADAKVKAQRVPEASLRQHGAQHFADKLVAELRVAPLVIDFPGIQATTEDVEVDVSHHPNFSRSRHGRALHPGTRFNLRFGFTGFPDLFTMQGGGFTSMRPRGEVESRDSSGGTLVIVVDVPRGTDAAETAAALGRVRSEQQRLLEQYVGFQKDSIDEFNTTLPGIVLACLQARIAELRSTESVLETLGIPLASKAGSPALPVRLHQQIDLDAARTIAVKSAPPRDAVPIQRTITDADHENIISLIRHQCRTFEGAPEAFSKLDEEHLRDVIRSSLNAVYRVATAEAFRSHGKTDICIEAESRAAFVAECKVWSGSKGLTEAIDQLLGYLTWRDCKAAIVVFNKDVHGFADLLAQKVTPCFASHANYVRTLSGSPSEGEWRFVLRHSDGQDVACHLMVFNLNAKRD